MDVSKAKYRLALKRYSPIEMAKYAFKYTSFYKEYYKGYNLENFDEIPMLTKHDIIGRSPYELLSNEYKNKVFLYGETSGSSGAPTPSFFTQEDFRKWISLSSLSLFIPNIKAILDKNRTVVNGLTFGFTVAGFSIGAFMQNCGALVAQLGSRSTIAMPERMSKTIAKLCPSIICSTPLDFMIWMSIIKEDQEKDYDRTVDNIKMLLSTAEPCSLSRKRQIENYFNLRHVNIYASVDGFFSIPCICGELHVLDELHYIQLYNDKLKCIGSRGTGRLCFTNLFRKTTPMVKYLLDDLVTVEKSSCVYGFKKSIKPHGRYELSLNINNKLVGNLDFEEIIYRHGLFMDYRVEVYEDSMLIKVEEYMDAKKDYNLKALEEEMVKNYGLKCKIILLPTGTLVDYRRVRETKSIIKVIDKRKSSKQQFPRIL